MNFKELNSELKLARYYLILLYVLLWSAFDFLSDSRSSRL
jgi:hypothetical protein